jgi:hypothetical protein
MVKIRINIDEIEFDVEEGEKEQTAIRAREESRGLVFTFHDRIRIKNAFEKELTRLLFSDTKNYNKNSLINNILTNDSFKSGSGNINFVKEELNVEDEFNLSIGIDKKGSDPFFFGKALARSIYSSLTNLEKNNRSYNSISSEKLGSK